MTTVVSASVSMCWFEQVVFRSKCHVTCSQCDAFFVAMFIMFTCLVFMSCSFFCQLFLTASRVICNVTRSMLVMFNCSLANSVQLTIGAS